MISHKDMARKTLSGCSHIQPVIVPCKECTERNLQSWEVEVRRNEKESLRNEWRQIEKERDLAVGELAAVNAVCDRLKAAVGALETANQSLRDKLTAAHKLVDEMRISLHAEQAWRNTPRIPVVND